ncbi:MAG TPA: DUF1254 domain-containing protein [Candidatus Tumulicola sp.]|jgi:hypothetical protein
MMKPVAGKPRLSTALFFAMVFLLAAFPPSAAAQGAQPAQIEAAAREAYIYGFPMVDLYRIMFGYFIDSRTPAFKGPFNTLVNSANVYTPADTTVQTPNSDTPYSFIGLDLRADGLVFTMPAIEKNRYYSAQFVDQYTYNIAYAGTRTTGNGGAKILIVGPDWKGPTPSAITKVVRFDTEFGLVGIRTQLFGPSDLDNVRKIQAGYTVQSLSSYLGTTAPPAAPAVDWLPPLTPAEERTSPQAFNLLAFILQFCPTRPSEVALRQSFASIGIVPGKPFDAGSRASSYVAGMAAGQKGIDTARAAVTGTNDLFGTPEEMHDNYLNRAVGAQYGILGNSVAEAQYFGITKSSNGQPLSGSANYTIHFAKGEFPPARAFWSVTLYNLPQQLLVANPISRYLINSPMLPSLKLDNDGGLTIYIQSTSPGTNEESNWLPAPAGPFFMILRVYWPKESAINGQWKPPLVTVAT